MQLPRRPPDQVGVIAHQRNRATHELVRHLDLVGQVELLELIDELIDVADLLPARIACFAQRSPASFQARRSPRKSPGSSDHHPHTSTPVISFHRMSQDRPGQEARFPALRVIRVARTRSTQDVVLRAAREGASRGLLLPRRPSRPRAAAGRVAQWIAPAGLGAARLGAAAPLPGCGGGHPLRRRARRSSTRWRPTTASLPGSSGRTTCWSTAASWPASSARSSPRQRRSTGVAVALGLGVNLRVERFPRRRRGGQPAHPGRPRHPAPRTLLIGMGCRAGHSHRHARARRDRRDPRPTGAAARSAWVGRSPCRAPAGIIERGGGRRRRRRRAARRGVRSDASLPRRGRPPRRRAAG